jgi:5-methylcytosine-specific restriction protein B
MGANIHSKECGEVLALLASTKNVLISGPPGTGKTRLLAEVADAFLANIAAAPAATAAIHNPQQPIPIPAVSPVPNATASGATPAANRASRKVFRTVFHQNSKHRDFVSGIAPAIGPGAVPGTFVVVEGTLYRASEHAKAAGGAALLVIDEINRGPAVQVFGGALVAIESDKRLAADGSTRKQTQFFEMITPPNGQIIEYALPEYLYILAVQNQADTSVEPLDVAFLRRWEPYRLDPDPVALRGHYGLPAANGAVLPSQPADVLGVYEASVRAWEAVNRRIALGRGQEFRIGHGVLMHGSAAASTIDEAKTIATNGWVRIMSHIEEVFFGDVRGVSATLNAINGPAYHPLKLQEQTFADDLRYELTGLSSLRDHDIYTLLRAIVE